MKPLTKKALPKWIVPDLVRRDDETGATYIHFEKVPAFSKWGCTTLSSALLLMRAGNEWVCRREGDVPAELEVFLTSLITHGKEI